MADPTELEQQIHEAIGRETGLVPVVPFEDRAGKQVAYSNRAARREARRAMRQPGRKRGRMR